MRKQAAAGGRTARHSTQAAGKEEGLQVSDNCSAKGTVKAPKKACGSADPTPCLDLKRKKPLPGTPEIF